MRLVTWCLPVVLVVPAFAHAAETVYEINGTFGSNEQNCSQIATVLGGVDCTFGRNRPGALTAAGVPVWIGPQFAAGHHVADGIKDVIGYVPTSGIFDPATATFSPAVDAQDTVVFRQQLGKPSVGPVYNAADLNCSGAVNAQDVVLFRQLLGRPPGPSGLVP